MGEEEGEKERQGDGERLSDLVIGREGKAHWAALVGILILAVVLRVGVALYLGDVVDAPPLLTDQRSYHALGARLAGWPWLQLSTGWYPFTPAETPTAHWSFLYSLYVAGVYGLFGVHPLAAAAAGRRRSAACCCR